jgi:hypothetical protein
MIRFNLYDKTEWEDGPWKQEVDFQAWIDEGTMYPCIVRRNLFGAWVGYVGIDHLHPLYGTSSEAEEFQYIETHNGSPTFAHWQVDDNLYFNPPIKRFYIGLDCMHDDDYIPWLDKPKKGRRKKNAPTPDQYRDFYYITATIEHLAYQIGLFDSRLVSL